MGATVKRRGYVFAWEGGDYVEVARVETPDKPFEVINVSNAPIVAVSPLGLNVLLEAWHKTFDGGLIEAFRHLDTVSDAEQGESERTRRRMIAADLAAVAHHNALARDALARVNARMVAGDEHPRAPMAVAHRKACDIHDLVNAAIVLRRGRNG